MQNHRVKTDDLIYSGRVLDLHRVVLEMSDGSVIERELLHYNGAAVVLPLLDDGRIVLIRNRRFAVGEDLWELPAGNLEEGEDPCVAAARELTEETGYTAGRIEKLGQFFAAPGTSDETLHTYVATQLSPGPQRLERYEEITTAVMSQAQVRGMIVRGEIHDAKTIASLGLFWMRRLPLA